MATTIIAPGNFSEYSSCRVKITVTGGCDQGIMRKGKYTKTIPYNCLSQTIQSIHRLGGKITQITLLTSQTPVSQIECEEQPLSTIAAMDILDSVHPTELAPQVEVENHPDTTSEKNELITVSPEQKPRAIAVFQSGDYTFIDEW
ncbi:hypothetical protein CLI64_15670 [Nostoc sp. CENA543]|uniref:phycobilisome linker polypeptide n=1 Tax=Nostoc sp. CENA543 TaxID=1869241 RepID=UPI000CA23AC4|nr:phycobilisome linker polypeptide [Nostoc sp. CENA543]AUT01707.1 hypothetical protein CLI64_15670 [Nostoc sp. CENA543]